MSSHVRVRPTVRPNAQTPAHVRVAPALLWSESCIGVANDNLEAEMRPSFPAAGVMEQDVRSWIHRFVLTMPWVAIVRYLPLRTRLGEPFRFVELPYL